MLVRITVIGSPAPQGSKRAWVNKHTGKAVMIEQAKSIRPWREAVKLAAFDVFEKCGICRGALRVEMAFTLKALKKPGGRQYPDRPPDLSKLVRGVEDALTDSGIWEDDARVVLLMASKVYVGAPDALPVPGVSIVIDEMVRSESASGHGTAE